METQSNLDTGSLVEIHFKDSERSPATYARVYQILMPNPGDYLIISYGKGEVLHIYYDLIEKMVVHLNEP